MADKFVRPLIHVDPPIREFKLGLWLAFRPNVGSDLTVVFVQSMDGQYARLSNGLTINLEGQVLAPLDDYKQISEYGWADCNEFELEVTDSEKIASEQHEERSYDSSDEY